MYIKIKIKIKIWKKYHMNNKINLLKNNNKIDFMFNFEILFRNNDENVYYT